MKMAESFPNGQKTLWEEEKLLIYIYTTFFPEPLTTLFTCFSRGEWQKKVRLNWVSNSQPSGHESDTVITEPPGPGILQEEIFQLLRM